MYEDLVDHDELRRAPQLASLVGKRAPKGANRRERDCGHGLAGSRTLNRLELSRPDEADADRYRRASLDHGAVDDLLNDVFLDAHRRAQRKIVLDLDATDDPLYGKQEGRFFRDYYDRYCYLPLYIFCGEHLLRARLRRPYEDGAAGSDEELERMVSRIRARWPKVQVVVRGDSGSCRDWLMSWCEERNVDYVLGVARNARLQEQVAPLLSLAECDLQRCGRTVKHFGSFRWRTLEPWSRERLVIAKGEHSALGSKPRFIVTSLRCWSRHDAERLYPKVYCARGAMEHRIKEQQLYLFADRTGAHTMLANQLRLHM